VSIGKYWLSFLFLFFISVQAWPADAMSAGGLLTRLHEAFDRLNFEVSLIRVQNRRIEPLRFTHGVVDGLEISHLVYLNGPPREVVQRGSLFSYFEVDQTPYTVRADRLPGVVANLVDGDIERMLGSYRLLKVGRSRVAGRPADVLRIVPMDEHRYGFLLWLDSESYLPLRLDIQDRDGELMEQHMVVSVLVFAEPSAWLRELARVELPAVVDGSGEGIQPGWRLQWMPQGFGLDKASRHRLAMTGRLVEHLQLSDGMVSVSVYISDTDDPDDSLPAVRVSKGSTSMVAYHMAGKEIALVGELPMETLQRMAQSVVPVAADSQTDPENTQPEVEVQQP